MLWTKGKSNKEILQNVTPSFSLETVTKMLKMRYFGHVMKTHQPPEEDIMLRITAGASKKGKHRMRWREDMRSLTGRSVNNIFLNL